MKSLKDLVDAVSEETGFRKCDVKKMYRGLVSAIKKEANSEDTVDITLPQIGKIKISVKEAYIAKNPSNNTDVEVPARRRAYFKIFKQFNRDLNA
jgi:nucleoid DNA-binding protein